MFAEEKMYKVVPISRSLAKKLDRLIDELRSKGKDIRDYGDAIEFLVEFYGRFKNRFKNACLEQGVGGAQGGNET